MAVTKHTHPVYDTDTHFTVDPITRQVTNAQLKKTFLMQRDHNSEVLTFEIPRYVEGHDMTLCDCVEIHYNNVGSSKSTSVSGIYQVDDLAIAETAEDTLVFSWTVSENATTYAGSLNFILIFECTVDGNTVYRWSSNICGTISVTAGIYNNDAIEEVFPDILAQWKNEIFSKNFAYEVAKEHGFTGTEEEWVASLKGERGDTGLFVGPTEPEGYPYFWFDTSGNRESGLTLTLSDLTDSTIFVDVGGTTYSLENSTLDSDTVAENTYNFDIV